jgi:DNA-binding beta-propeller fold protein YncE
MSNWRNLRRGPARAIVVAAGAVALALPAGAVAFGPIAVMGGTGIAQLGVPLGVAAGGAGGVYVAEHTGQRVSRFATTGVFTRAWGFDVRPGGATGFELCTRATGCQPGRPGGGPGQLGFPGGIATDDSGSVYVTDPANDRVSQFTSPGAFVRAFGFDVKPGGRRGFEICTQATGCKRGVAGGRAGQFDRPAYVTTDQAGGVYVTDEGNHRVNQFTAEGTFVRAWGFNVRPGRGVGFEVCTKATRCRRGEPGGRAGQLSFPDGVAADGAGNLYVADANSRVNQFTTEGVFVRAFGFGVRPGGGRGFEVCTRATGCRRGIPGGGAGQLSFVLGVGADESGNVYVGDTGNSRVSQFTANGAFVRAFGLDVVPGGREKFEVCTIATGCKRGRATTRPGGFLSPSAVAVSPGGSIYVSDLEAGRITCFGEPGSTPCIRNLFRFGALELDRERGSARLEVIVPGPGRLLARGNDITRVLVRADAAGMIRLPVRPRGEARRELGQDGKARVEIDVIYTPIDGGPHERPKRIELRKRR